MSDNSKKIVLYIISIIILFVFIFVVKKMFHIRENNIRKEFVLKLKSYEVKSFKNNNVPYFDYPLLDSKIEKYLNSFNKDVSISYEVNFTQNILDVFLKVKDGNNYSYNSIFYDLEKLRLVDSSSVFDINSVRDIILESVKNKYSKRIYKNIVSDEFKNAHINYSDNKVSIYFDNRIFNYVSYEVFIDILKDNVNVVSEEVYDKVVAFTFDDGPSDYTLDIVNALLLNDSKATFFELGNRMKYNQNITREIYNLGMEVASHTYSHKNLVSLDINGLESEINSTNIIFNEITGGTISLVRPPYGEYNNLVRKEINKPIILWNVDTQDWLHKDEERIYKHILNNISDGSIILMHDIYPSTLEAVKMVLPVLKEMGYKVTTVSELAKEKGYTLNENIVYRFFK